MMASMKAWLVVLLCVSASGELAGTATVWVTYMSGAKLAAQIRREVGLQDALEEQATEWHKERQLAEGIDPPLPVHFGEEGATIMLRDLRAQVADQLGRTWWQTWGLVAFVVGAVTGLTAGLLAVLG
jgi:hypothetical protein